MVTACDVSGRTHFSVWLVFGLIQLAEVEFLALVPRFGLDKLLRDICPISHPALHNALHQPECLVCAPLAMDQRKCQIIIHEVLAVRLMIEALPRLAPTQAVQAEDYVTGRRRRHVFNLDAARDIPFAHHAQGCLCAQELVDGPQFVEF